MSWASIFKNATCWTYNSDTGRMKKYTNVVIKASDISSPRAVACHKETKRMFLVSSSESDVYSEGTFYRVWLNTDDDYMAHSLIYSTQ